MADGVNRDEWCTPFLRQIVRTEIGEHILSGNPTTKSVSEMENDIYLKAKNKEEYLSLVATLIQVLRGINERRMRQQIPERLPDSMSDDQVVNQYAWCSPLHRQNVVTKIEEVIRVTGSRISKTVAEMEDHMYRNARTKEEYLGFVARLILYLRETQNRRMQQQFPERSPDAIISDDQIVNRNTVKPLLRQKVVMKIEEVIGGVAGNPTNKTVAEIEHYIYLKAETKEEYKYFAARVTLQLIEMKTKRDKSRDHAEAMNVDGDEQIENSDLLRLFEELEL